MKDQRDINEIIYLADKYARQKDHRCLFPGCNRKAINSHAIPRASIYEALAEKGFVYTRNYSFVTMMRKKSLYDPVEFIEVGVNKASAFKGYCPQHDSSLFAAADTADPDNKKHLAIPLHLRAMSLEYARKRYVSDYLQRIVDLSTSKGCSFIQREQVEKFEKAKNNAKLLLDDFWAFRDSITFLVLLINSNINVSCCGVFNQAFDHKVGFVGYNIISFSNTTILCLSAYLRDKKNLDFFLASHHTNGEMNLEKLINETAFLKGEEPLISPPFWRSLTEDERLTVRHSLRHPAFRLSTNIPAIIRLNRGDSVPNALPATWGRFMKAFSAR